MGKLSGSMFQNALVLNANNTRIAKKFATGQIRNKGLNGTLIIR